MDINFDQFPISWPIISEKAKIPCKTDWGRGMSRKAIAVHLKNNQADGIALILGVISGFVAVDLDGPGATNLWQQWQEENELAPTTVEWTSGREGRSCRIFSVPDIFWNQIKSRNYKADDGTDIEIRWGGTGSCKQTLPPSIHHGTKKPYQWINSPDSTEVAIAPDWLIEKMLIEEQKPQPLPAISRPITQPGAVPIPIEVCLTTRDRDDLVSGVPVGGRNQAAFRIGANAIATERELQRLGYSTTNTAEQIYWDFCRLCGLDQKKEEIREARATWQSALRSSEGASLTEEALINCANAYIYRESRQVVGGRPVSLLGRSSQPNSNLVPHPTIRQIPPIETFIENLIEEGETRSSVRIKVAEYSALARVSSHEIYKALGERQEELDRITNKDINRKLIEDLLSAQGRSLNLRQILPIDLAKAIERKASSFNLDPALFLLPLLSAVSSLSNPGKRLVVKRGFLVPPAINSCLVGNSGTMKSPIIDSMINPLEQIQIQEIERFKQAIADYEDEINHWKASKEKETDPPEPPTMKQYLITDGTWEGILDALSDQESGFLYVADELQSLQDFLDRQGRRGDVLSLFNSKMINKRLKGTSYKDKHTTIKNPLMPLVGGTQTEIYQDYLRESKGDASGFWARFLVGYVPDTTSDLFSDGEDLDPILTDLYRTLMRLEQESTQIRLSQEAKDIYNEMDKEAQAKKHGSSPTFRNVLAKSRGYIARIALALQSIKDACRLSPSLTQVIDGETMAGAVAIMRYHLQQASYIHTLTGQGEIGPELLKILETSNGEWISPTDAMRSSRDLRRAKAEKLRAWFAELAGMGMGEIRGKGRTLMFRSTTTEITSELPKLPDNYHLITTPDKGSNLYIERDTEIDSLDNYQITTPPTFSDGELTEKSIGELMEKSIDSGQQRIDPPWLSGNLRTGETPETQTESGFDGSQGVVIKWLSSGNSESEVVFQPPVTTPETGLFDLDDLPELEGDGKMDELTAEIFRQSFIDCESREQVEETKSVIREGFGSTGLNMVARLLTPAQLEALKRLPSSSPAAESEPDHTEASPALEPDQPNLWGCS